MSRQQGIPSAWYVPFVLSLSKDRRTNGKIPNMRMNVRRRRGAVGALREAPLHQAREAKRPYTKRSYAIRPYVTYQKPFQLTKERKEQWQRQCP